MTPREIVEELEASRSTGLGSRGEEETDVQRIRDKLDTHDRV